MAVTDAAHVHAAYDRRGVYGISVMSELSGVGPQTLRLYERRGLLTPARTGGGTRRYSEADLATLTRISALNRRRHQPDCDRCHPRPGKPERDPGRTDRSAQWDARGGIAFRARPGRR